MEKIKEPGDENVTANLNVPAHPTGMFLDDKRDSDDVKNIQLLDVQYISVLIKDGHASPKSFNQRKDL